MFPLHESTQRRLCRILFVAGCIVPTLAVTAYAVWLRTPAYRTAQSKMLSTATGVQFSLDALLHPRPGQTRLSNVAVHDPETGRLVAQIDELELTRQGESIAIVARRPTVHGENITDIFERLEHHFLRGPEAAGSISIVCDQLTAQSTDAEAQTLTDVRVILEANETARTLTADYRIAGINMPTPARIRVARRPRSDGRVTQIQWRTGEAALPVAPWMGQFPWLVHLGDRCHFQGELTAELTASEWQGEVRGVLTNIDLEQFVSNQFMHKLSGPTDVTIESARFVDGQLVDATGQLRAGPGVIGDSLLQSATTQWKLKPSSAAIQPESADALHRYETLAFDFVLDAKQLRVVGACAGSAEGTILTTKDGRHWTTSDKSSAAVSLVRVLVPESEFDVPATSSTRRLIQWLPLPPVEQKDGDTPRAHVHTEK